MCLVSGVVMVGAARRNGKKDWKGGKIEQRRCHCKFKDEHNEAGWKQEKASCGESVISDGLVSYLTLSWLL